MERWRRADKPIRPGPADELRAQHELRAASWERRRADEDQVLGKTVFIAFLSTRSQREINQRRDGRHRLATSDKIKATNAR